MYVLVFSPCEDGDRQWRALAQQKRNDEPGRPQPSCRLPFGCEMCAMIAARSYSLEISS